MPEWPETHPGVEEMRVAVMGCVVNGPGESKHADIGISLPGTFEEPVAPVFIDGKLDRTLRGEGLVDEFIGILEDYVERRYPGRSAIPGDLTIKRQPGSPSRQRRGTSAGSTWVRPHVHPTATRAVRPRSGGPRRAVRPDNRPSWLSNERPCPGHGVRRRARPRFEASTHPGVYFGATERPLHDVGDPHVSFCRPNRTLQQKEAS